VWSDAAVTIYTYISRYREVRIRMKTESKKGRRNELEHIKGYWKRCIGINAYSFCVSRQLALILQHIIL
jgi:hypothetical protein